MDQKNPLVHSRDRKKMFRLPIPSAISGTKAGAASGESSRTRGVTEHRKQGVAVGTGARAEVPADIRPSAEPSTYVMHSRRGWNIQARRLPIGQRKTYSEDRGLRSDRRGHEIVIASIEQSKGGSDAACDSIQRHPVRSVIGARVLVQEIVIGLSQV